jgi:hypothetical protein
MNKRKRTTTDESSRKKRNPHYFIYTMNEVKKIKKRYNINKYCKKIDELLLFPLIIFEKKDLKKNNVILNDNINVLKDIIESVNNMKQLFTNSFNILKKYLISSQEKEEKYNDAKTLIDRSSNIIFNSAIGKRHIFECDRLFALTTTRVLDELLLKVQKRLKSEERTQRIHNMYNYIFDGHVIYTIGQCTQLQTTDVLSITLTIDAEGSISDIPIILHDKIGLPLEHYIFLESERKFEGKVNIVLYLMSD